MSRIALEPDQNGSGVFTIASPNSNTSRTLNLPDAAGTLDRLQRAGNVLQVVSVNNNTQYASTSSTFADTFSASITPTSASNKVLVLATISIQTRPAGATVVLPITRLLKDSSVLQTYGYSNYVAGNIISGSYITPVYLDSPGTTSSVNYKIQLAREANSNGGTVYINYSDPAGSQISTITLMEIAA
jgi:hypothetical protein